MKKGQLIDLSGPIYSGMWTYDHPYPKLRIEEIEGIKSGEKVAYAEEFFGMHSQTGTYLETEAHYYGLDQARSLDSIPLSNLIDIDCVVIQLDNIEVVDLTKYSRFIITKDKLQKAAKSVNIKPGQAILLSTGWGKYWSEDYFISKAPMITFDAMQWIIEKEPFILGSDSPRWENDHGTEGIFPIFYEKGILMLAPLVHLEDIKPSVGKLSVLPLAVQNTTAAPCRAVFSV